MPAVPLVVASAAPIGTVVIRAVVISAMVISTVLIGAVLIRTMLISTVVISTVVIAAVLVTTVLVTSVLVALAAAVLGTVLAAVAGCLLAAVAGTVLAVLRAVLAAVAGAGLIAVRGAVLAAVFGTAVLRATVALSMALPGTALPSMAVSGTTVRATTVRARTAVASTVVTGTVVTGTAVISTAVISTAAFGAGGCTVSGRALVAVAGPLAGTRLAGIGGALLAITGAGLRAAVTRCRRLVPRDHGLLAAWIASSGRSGVSGRLRRSVSLAAGLATGWLSPGEVFLSGRERLLTTRPAGNRGGRRGVRGEGRLRDLARLGRQVLRPGRAFRAPLQGLDHPGQLGDRKPERTGASTPLPDAEYRDLSIGIPAHPHGPGFSANIEENLAKTGQRGCV